MSSQHMRDYMDGRIDSTEYVRRVKADSERLVAEIRAGRAGQDRRAARARSALLRAKRLLRGARRV